MKIQNIDNVDKFFDVIKECEGKVELVTKEGDRINLKSSLAKYIAVANYFADGTVKEVEVVAYELEDLERLIHYLLEGG